MNRVRFPLSGATAGAFSALAFTAIHDVLISDIWFSTIPMLAAGAICGASISFTYALLFTVPSVRSWLGYVSVYVGVLALLGLASVVAFEPVTTVAAVIAANEPPTELFARAMPMTLGFLFSMAGLLSFLFGRSWRKFGAILVTCALLTLFLGLNVSVIGLVYVPKGSAFLIAELFGLIFVLGATYAAAVTLVERQALTRTRLERGPADVDASAR